MDANYKKGLESNIWKFHLASVFMAIGTMFRGILFLFYASIFLKPLEFGIITSIFAFVIIIFEVPSGIIADKFGRKNTAALGGVFALCALVFWFFSTTFFAAAVGAVFFGLFNAFRSGSGEALMYDSHVQLKKEKRYKEFASKNFAYTMYTVAIFSVIAGYLASINFRLVFGMSIVFAFLYIFLILSMNEPVVKPKKKGRSEKYFLGAMKEVMGNKKIFWIFVYGFVIAGIIEGIYKFHPIFVSGVGFTVFHAGILIGAMFFVSAFSAQISLRVHSVIKEKNVILLSPIVVGLLYILVASVYNFSFSWLLILEAFIVGLTWPYLEDLKNRYLSSSKRATLLSISSFAIYVMVMVVSLGVGLLTELMDLRWIYILLGIIFIVFGGYAATRILAEIHYSD